MAGLLDYNFPASPSYQGLGFTRVFTSIFMKTLKEKKRYYCKQEKIQNQLKQV